MTPPHAALSDLRKVSGLTLEEVGDRVGKILGLDKPLSRGTLSAIESGKKGVSRQLLDAIAAAYGLESGRLTTDYDPRSSKIHKAAS